MGDFAYTMIENVDKEQVDKELEEAYKEAMATFNRGSADDMMKLYAEDCIFLELGQNVQVNGNKAVTDLYKDLVLKYEDYDFVPIHRTYIKNAVGEVGSVSVKCKSTGEIKKHKYAGINVKKDGRWVVQYDIVGHVDL